MEVPLVDFVLLSKCTRDGLEHLDVHPIGLEAVPDLEAFFGPSNLRSVRKEGETRIYSLVNPRGDLYSIICRHGDEFLILSWLSNQPYYETFVSVINRVIEILGENLCASFLRPTFCESFYRQVSSPKAISKYFRIKVPTPSASAYLPFFDVKYERLLALLDVPNIVTILNVFLNELKVVFYSSSETLLFLTIQALSSLLYPFEYQFPLIPFVEDPTNVLQAPFSIVCGTTFLDPLEKNVSDVVVVLIDDNLVLEKGLRPETKRCLPTVIRKHLIEVLGDTVAEMGGVPRNMSSDVYNRLCRRGYDLFRYPRSTTRWKSSSGLLFGNPTASEVQDAMEDLFPDESERSSVVSRFRFAILHAFSRMLMCFQRFFYTGHGQEATSYEYDHESLLSVQQDYKHFMRSFVETMCFNDFLAKYVERSPRLGAFTAISDRHLSRCSSVIREGAETPVTLPVYLASPLGFHETTISVGDSIEISKGYIKGARTIELADLLSVRVPTREAAKALTTVPAFRRKVRNCMETPIVLTHLGKDGSKRQILFLARTRKDHELFFRGISARLIWQRMEEPGRSVVRTGAERKRYEWKKALYSVKEIDYKKILGRGSLDP